MHSVQKKKIISGRSYLNYEQSKLNKAIPDIKKNSISIKKAAEKYRVPKSTNNSNTILYRQYAMNTIESNSEIRKPGRSAALSKLDKATLVKV